MPYTPILSRPHPVGSGTQDIYMFENRYGASVVQFPGSYGYDKGLYELAVIHYPTHPEGPTDFGITYSTPITGDVVGWLTLEDVQRILADIAVLPSPLTERPS